MDNGLDFLLTGQDEVCANIFCYTWINTLIKQTIQTEVHGESHLDF